MRTSSFLLPPYCLALTAYHLLLTTCSLLPTNDYSRLHDLDELGLGDLVAREANLEARDLHELHGGLGAAALDAAVVLGRRIAVEGPGDLRSQLTLHLTGNGKGRLADRDTDRHPDRVGERREEWRQRRRR